MAYPKVPRQLIGTVAPFREAFISVAVQKGQTVADAAALADLVPEQLCGAPCFLDKLTSQWLYAYGCPIILSGDPVYGVGVTYHPLAILIEVLVCAQVRMTEPVFKDYLTRTTDPVKHADMLSEFTPILQLETSTKVEYEVTEHSPGNRRVDWLIMGQDGFGLLLEVKLRKADLIRGLERIQMGYLTKEGKGPVPDHDHDLLFKSVEEKFLSKPLGQIVQGVWIHTPLKQERCELEQSFMRMDPNKVHFAIIGSWDRRVHLITREGVQRCRVLHLLQVQEEGGLVFDRQAES